MVKKISLICLLAFMVIAFSFLTSSGQDMEYKEYKVLKGDTLWDISSKEIHDPFLWPKIWKENPDIKNPDRISPSQMIKNPSQADSKRAGGGSLYGKSICSNRNGSGSSEKRRGAKTH